MKSYQYSKGAIDSQAVNTIVQEMLRRSDILEENEEKAITFQRFLVGAIHLKLPTFS